MTDHKISNIFFRFTISCFITQYSRVYGNHNKFYQNIYVYDRCQCLLKIFAKYKAIFNTKWFYILLST